MKPPRNAERDPTLEPIRRDARRKQGRRRRPAENPLLRLGALGAIGWSVAIPTVGGVLLGLWLDRVAPARISWPIALMLGGLVIGILVAWDWVTRQDQLNRSEQSEASDTEEEDA